MPEEIRQRTPTTDTYSAGSTQEEFFFRLPFDILDMVWLGYERGVPSAGDRAGAWPVGRAGGAGDRRHRAQAAHHGLPAKRSPKRSCIEGASRLAMNRQFPALSGLAMLLIVLNHTIEMGTSVPVQVGYPPVEGAMRTVLSLLQGLGVFAVPTFLFISGTFVAYAARGEPPKLTGKFLKNSLSHICGRICSGRWCSTWWCSSSSTSATARLATSRTC